MVIDSSKHTRKTPVRQASPAESSQPNKINANTHFDFEGKNLDALATMRRLLVQTTQTAYEARPCCVGRFNISFPERTGSRR
jgi:hypothetical protein